MFLRIQLTQNSKDKADIAIDECSMEHGKMIQVGALNEHSLAIGMDSFADCLNNQHNNTRKRKKNKKTEETWNESDAEAELQNKLTHWKRIILLIAAVTIHVKCLNLKRKSVSIEWFLEYSGRSRSWSIFWRYWQYSQSYF